MYKLFVAGVLGMGLALSIALSQADAATFERSVILGPGAGQLQVERVNVGDAIVLNLQNPTNVPLVFEVSEALGQQTWWTVGAHCSERVTLNYFRPFNQDISYVVRDPSGAILASGLLIPAMEMPVSEIVPVQPIQIIAPVRGYW